jgi:hypothetical protein
MQRMPLTNVTDRRDHFRRAQTPAAPLVPCHVHLTQSKQGISSIELGRRLGVTQTTAWKLKHKLQQVMMERDADKHLTGRVEIDDAYLGGERTGGKRGRGAVGKTPFVAAVETTENGKPVCLKLGRVSGFSSAALSGFAKRYLAASCTVLSDGLPCFAAVTEAGCTHQVIKTGGGPAAARKPACKWVNTTLGNIKAAIVGTLRSSAPTGRSAVSTFRVISPSSNIASIAGMTWQQ